MRGKRQLFNARNLFVAGRSSEIVRKYYQIKRRRGESENRKFFPLDLANASLRPSSATASMIVLIVQTKTLALAHQIELR